MFIPRPSDATCRLPSSPVPSLLMLVSLLLPLPLLPLLLLLLLLLAWLLSL
jgi:hypothetical protein